MAIALSARPKMTPLPPRRSEQKATPESAAADSLDARAEQLRAVEIDFIDNPEFHQPQAAERIFGPDFDLSEAIREDAPDGPSTPPKDMPAHLARLCAAALLSPEQETDLFRKMNFAKQQAAAARERIGKRRLKPEMIDRAEKMLQLADLYRNRIIQANMRLVMSIVKKFVNPKVSFDDLLSEGIVSIMRAVDKFDYDRGFRFSTYATQVVRRNSYRTVVAVQKDNSRFANSFAEETFDVPDERPASTLSEKQWAAAMGSMNRMLDRLDEREQHIVRARFGLTEARSKQTFQSLANELGVCKERVRQLAERALKKLQAMAGEENLAQPEGTL